MTGLRFILLLAALLAPAAAVAQGDGWTSDTERIANAGFAPVEVPAAKGFEVRRLVLLDGYGSLPIPGIEFQRDRAGRTTFQLQFRDYRTEPVTLAAGTWERIVAGDAALFAVPAEPWERLTAPSTAGVCHGWMTVVQATDGRTSSWWECRDKAGPWLDAVKVMLAAVLATTPDCAPEKDSYWRFTDCFSEKEELDDPLLQATYGRLLEEWGALPGAERLAAARRALRAPGLALGNPAWREARTAVRAVLKVGEERRLLLLELGKLSYGAAMASPADRSKIRRTMRYWHDFTVSQEQNHAEILGGLAWAADPADGKGDTRDDSRS